jgi:homeodomain-containing protein/Homeodomain-like domain-containing protein
MAGPLPQAITVTAAQQTVLERLLRQHTCPQALARRVKIVLAAATGQPNEVIAAQLNCSPTTIRLWRARWANAAAQLAAVDTDTEALPPLMATVLADAPRPGAPATFTAEQIVQIIALACTPPGDSGRPIDAWTPRELADEATKRQIIAAISPSSVSRFLKSGPAAAPSQPLLAEHDGT